MKSNKNILSQPVDSILSEHMDIGTKEFEDFKLLIRSKVAETSKEDRIKIAILGLKFEMEDYLKSYTQVVPVGKFVKKFIELIEIKQVEFANYLDIRPSNLSKILNGERRLTIELALIIERLSNIDAELWLRIQNDHEIRVLQESNAWAIEKYNLEELIN
ncbi:MAG: HigA family addiction module antidote protein [Saprospiraceae bacterium]|nr:HigA family addiction module antidote protein [Saprospiraceae bacterium]